MKGYEIPLILIGEQKGLYSFAQALAAAMKAKTESDASSVKWMILLPPVKTIGDDIKHKHAEYLRSLELLLSA